MLKFDQFLNLIEDGAWHSLKELSKHSNIPKQKLANLSKMLSKSNIVEYENEKSQIRIRQEWQQILRNTREEKNCEKTAVGHIILPPKKSINIQGILLTNLTEKELELGMRVDKKLEELAIGIID